MFKISRIYNMSARVLYYSMKTGWVLLIICMNYCPKLWISESHYKRKIIVTRKYRTETNMFFLASLCPWSARNRSSIAVETAWVYILGLRQWEPCILSRLSSKMFHSMQHYLTLSWQMSLSCRNQSIDLQCKSMGWFLYDRDLRHEKFKRYRDIYFIWKLRYCFWEIFQINKHKQFLLIKSSFSKKVKKLEVFAVLHLSDKR